jgi:branched-chain amino acid transport system substrate-binding protein
VKTNGGITAEKAGRRRPRLRGWFGVALVVGLTGCTLVGAGPGGTPAPAVADGPPIAEGASDPGRDRAAADLMAEAESRLASGDAAGARTLARQVAATYPEARGSSTALWIEARAEAALGAWPAADASVARYLDRVGDGHPEAPAARLLGAEARFRGELGGAVEAIFALRASVPAGVRDAGAALAREIAASLEDPALRDLMEEAPRHPWILPVFQVELAERRVRVGDATEGVRLARAALILDPVAEERERANRVIAGDVAPAEGAEGAVTGVLAALLAEGGPPGLAQLSQQVREGIEVALSDERYRGGVRLSVGSDRGDPGASAGGLAELAGARPFGMVGPLTDPGVVAAARSRTGTLPMISPTARLLPEGIEDVYSLAGIDPASARALAELIRRDGVDRVVVFHRDHAQEHAEFQWFREAFEGLGGQVVRTWSYATGSTTFQEPLEAIAAARPRALVLLLPAEDVELVAPQLAFYGVDDLESLTLYGGAAWSAPVVLQAVPVRHTEGIRTVTSHVGEGFGPAWDDFVVRYEARFQRTLRSPVAALGWDAARLLLEAASLEGSDPDEVARGLRRIRDFRGATGTFSWQDGRISRHFIPVRIENRTLVPLSTER